MARCACPSAKVTVPAAEEAKSMPASAVPLTAFQFTLTRPDSGCERLIRNTAATELSLVTMVEDSNEISLIGAAGRCGFATAAAAGAAFVGSADSIVALAGVGAVVAGVD